MTKKNRVLIICCIVALALAITVIVCTRNTTTELGVLTEEAFMEACPDALSYNDRYLAEVILNRADIDFDCAFTYNVNDEDNEICIYYGNNIGWHDEEEYRYVNLKVEGFSASEFADNFKEPNYFCPYYNEAFVWDFTLTDQGYITHDMVVSERVKDSYEDYDIMFAKDLVETDCKLIDEIRAHLPFTIKDGDCFFVLDSRTRMVGWFYFKTTYQGEAFAGCYEVDGWSGGTTYEDLINMKGIYFNGINCHSIYVGQRYD